MSKGIFVPSGKSLPIERKIDELGRVVIPIEWRRDLGIGDKELVKIYGYDNCIVISKVEVE